MKKAMTRAIMLMGLGTVGGYMYYFYKKNPRKTQVIIGDVKEMMKDLK